MKVILDTLPRLSYFTYHNYVYRIIDLEWEKTDEKSILRSSSKPKRLLSLGCNPILFKKLHENIWHEVKSRENEKLDPMILVQPCVIGPIYEYKGE